MAAITPQTGTITSREAEQVERANASDRTPVVFIHGLWLLPSSWDSWGELFEAAGCRFDFSCETVQPLAALVQRELDKIPG